MSFFKKLKDRMFRSSDKIGEGLEALVAEPAATPDAAPEAKPGLISRLIGRSDEPRRVLDDAMLESLEELLITADMGVDTATRVTANIAEGRFGKRISTSELRDALATEIARIMAPVARPLPLYPQKPQVVLVVASAAGKLATWAPRRPPWRVQPGFLALA